MPPGDKTRKILWGSSGNRRAMCRRELVIEATSRDAQAIVGEECHIISRKTEGPRFDQDYAAEKIDAVENLILLCAVHHKMVDDQPETYTAEILRKLKANREAWGSHLACR
ncbi:MAG: HNH endonuclease [Candidatus Binataceae bacterium]